MKVNPKIRELLTEISKESIEYANSGDEQYRYIRRFLNIFNNQLSQEEKIYLISAVLEFVHYRNITTDHDTLMTIADIKLKTFMGMATITVFLMVVAAILFRTNAGLNRIVDLLLEFTKVFSL